MTVESVLNNVLPELGVDRTGAQISAGDYEMRQIRALMNAAGRDIARRAEWSGLVRYWTVAGGVDEADLPVDFHRMAERGAVRLNKTGFHPVRAVVAPEQWEFLAARNSSQPYYHLAEGKLRFSPALDSDGARVRYLSSHWVDGRDAITQNGDNLLVPEMLVERGTIWRWKRQKGLAFDDLLAEFEADLIAEIKADRGAM